MPGKSTSKWRLMFPIGLWVEMAVISFLILFRSRPTVVLVRQVDCCIASACNPFSLAH